MSTLHRLPLFLLILGIACASMLVPAAFALAIEDFHDARSFFYAAVLGLTLTTLIALAQAGQRHNRSALRQLLALLGVFIALPAVLAVPFYEAVRSTTYLSAYVEMVSSLTTTGLTMFEPARLSGPEHLWRAQVGWMGGALMWVAAAAIMAPLTLGGFEVTASGEPGQTPSHGAMRRDQADPAERLARGARALLPTYIGLTGALCVMLLVAGDPPLVAISHAMSVMATSGISPLGQLTGATSGIPGEMILFCFLFFALSRLTFSSDTVQAVRTGLLFDPEFRLGLVIVLIVPTSLFVRHWVAAFDVGEEENIVLGLRALWGALFTALSFLTTTGFVSADWDTAQAWSGLSTPGLILMGLAIVGGGVATTAGGVKLLRVYALYVNGMREIEKLVYPSSVARSGLVSRRIRREGAFIAWVFFMLFAICIAAISVALGLFGIAFEPAMVLTIATLSNTGPLIGIASAAPIDFIALAPGAKLLLCVAMVLGRLELLAIIVMLTPEIWRD
ncbi:TrkH family potassium uptake protein [Thalassococcus sp. CAU 1522]|uniref:TrkH family potassium uptake protein n=1 Tax=Thalassococcus arenae TaxID=2851652 RepID=A0ABS6N9J3_9RHOB|nr:potassium transporter TrkG [Thalassococcus arenae]MBV2360686.1 TrkH family potassium uptake protein [Thalassococcus arenae]